MAAPSKGSLKKGSKSESQINKNTAKPGGFKGFKGLLKGNTKSKKEKKTARISDDASQQSTEVGSVKTMENTRAEYMPSPVATPEKQRNMPEINEEEVIVDTKKPNNISTVTANPSLEVILLLMDPTTRRFELLQLEFDSDKARVSDILAQIPLSVTEEAIRKQQYKGVSDKTNKARAEETRLIEFCSGMDVLVAIPKGLSVDECSRLARPILSDEKVLKMLKQTGVDISPWKKEAKAETTSKTRDLALDVGDSSRKITSKKIAFSQPVFPIIAICALVAILLQAAHNKISAPILPGVVIKPNTWRSKCGLLSFLPSCENAYMEVMKDGTVNFFDSNQELAMKMKGVKCPAKSSKSECVDGLLWHHDGHVSVGGSLIKSVVNYSSDGMVLFPWPFQEKPKIKVKFSQRKK